MAEQEPAFCPNCSKPAVRQGKVILCEYCDMSFRFTAEGPKLHELGSLESRVKTLEEKLGIGIDGKVVAAADAPGPEPYDDIPGQVDEVDEDEM